MLNIDKCIHNPEYSSAAMFVSLIFKTPLIKRKPQLNWDFKVVPLSCQLKRGLSNVIISKIVYKMYDTAQKFRILQDDSAFVPT
jgi:hypothetical protein